MEFYINESENYVLHSVVNEAFNGVSMSNRPDRNLKEKDYIFQKTRNYNNENILTYFTHQELCVILHCIQVTFKYIDPEDYHTHLGYEGEEVNKIKELGVILQDLYGEK